MKFIHKNVPREELAVVVFTTVIEEPAYVRTPEEKMQVRAEASWTKSSRTLASSAGKPSISAAIDALLFLSMREVCRTKQKG